MVLCSVSRDQTKSKMLSWVLPSVRLAENAVRDLPVMSWAEVAAEFDNYFRGLMAGG